MVQKRPFHDEEPFNFSSKHSRQIRHCDQLLSFSDFVPLDVSALELPFPGSCWFHGNSTKNDAWLSNNTANELNLEAEKDIKSAITSSRARGNDANNESDWLVTRGLGEETPNAELHIKTSSRVDMYDLLLRCPPRKTVPVGPNHQADIPELSLDSSASDEDKDAIRLMGTCVLPMPNSDSRDVGKRKSLINCRCPDAGSVFCVKQHVSESRERLARDLGEEKFAELGFDDMGEQVAEKWSEEDEHLFYEMVYTNPVSSGRNFWDHLSLAFPSRNRNHIVSYYFNVFVLRKRAEQNRLFPSNTDSDDEWREIDVYGYDEMESSEEEEDDVENELVDDNSCHNLHCLCYSDSSSPQPFTRKIPQQIRDGTSCSLTRTRVKTENGETWPAANLFRWGNSHEYFDGAYPICPKSNVDLLPTCSMIEEVFGDRSWSNCEGRDSKSLL